VGWLLSCLLLLSCAEPQPEKTELYVFGTLVNVSVSGADQAAAQSSFLELQEMFQYMHREWHAWEPGQLSTINQAFAAEQSALADLHIGKLIRHSQEYESSSGGRFNAAIGQLVGVWGFHTSDYPIRAAMPAEDVIKTLVGLRPSAHDINLVKADATHWQVNSSNPAVQLDFGGIAKGYAVDLAIQALATREFEGGIVNAGGDLRAYGTNHGHPWRIAIENPLGGIIGIIDIDTDESVFTSGNYQRFGEDDSGLRYAHILDPRTGWPVRNILSATVITDSGIAADAAATALVVAGLDEWKELARDMQLDTFLITDESGVVYMTPAMHQRLEFREEDQKVFKILE
jgi:thiamine biosynthesis lipoprotein